MNTNYKFYENLFGGIPEETEIDKLIKILNIQGNLCPVDWGVQELLGRPQIIFLNPETGERIGDAICHFGSCGHRKGLIEVMGYPFDDEDKDVVGNLTAEQVFHQMMTYGKF